MSIHALAIILSAWATTPSDERPVAAKEVYRCDFESAADQDYDGWPDGWIRIYGPGLPEFVKVGIVREPNASGENHSLQITLDGSGASACSQPIPISPQFSFVLSGRIKTAGLKHDAAWLTLTLQDSDGKTIETHRSPLVATAPQWQSVQIGPITPISHKTTHAVIAVHLQPQGRQEDLVGTAMFDDLLLAHLPRMTLRANNPTHIYTSRDGAELTCEVSGIPELYPAVTFELFDHLGSSLASYRQRLNASPDVAVKNTFAGNATWRPPLPDYGFYRVRVSLHGADRTVLHRTITLAMLRPMPATRRGEFGWTLPGHETPLEPGVLATLLGNVGIHWAKLPVWFDSTESAKAEEIARFIEQASIQGIEIVGILDEPPPELRQVFREKGKLPVASVFIEPELWQPSVTPVMTRLSLKVRWWQLGDDHDASFVGLPQVDAKILEIRREMEKVGQEIRLGMSWRWLYQPPSAESPPWAYLSYGSEPSMTAEELATYLATPATTQTTAVTAEMKTQERLTTSIKATQQATQRWVVLDPLPASEYSTATRARDLVCRMLTAKIMGAGAAFVPEPFHDNHGVMNADGTPGDLFLPWRTTSLLVSGKEYLGQIQLPGGSTNHVFAQDGKAVMVVWNDRPTEEMIFIGDEIEQIDLWGRSERPRQVTEGDQSHHVLEVGPLPIFITGISEAVARWQIGLSFEDTQLASLFGREQTIGLILKNHFGQSVGGEVAIRAPRTWLVDARPMRFKVADSDQLRLPIDLTLQTDANSGPQPVRLDFNITAERNYSFSVFRHLQLGLEDLQIELTTRLREDGAMIVEQQLTNLSERPVSFLCILFPPGRRRETRQIIDLGRGRNTLVFVLPRGEELLGKRLWLRAEEIGGPRVLNYTLTAER